MRLSEEPKLIYACLQVDALVSPFILRMLFVGFSGMPPFLLYGHHLTRFYHLSYM